MTISDRIKFFRKAKGWSQKDLGDSVGVIQTHVSKWETGMTPSATYIPQIATALDVPVADLVGEETVQSKAKPSHERPTKKDWQRMASLVADREHFFALYDLVELSRDLPPAVAERLSTALCRLLRSASSR